MRNFNIIYVIDQFIGIILPYGVDHTKQNPEFNITMIIVLVHMCIAPVYLRFWGFIIMYKVMQLTTSALIKRSTEAGPYWNDLDTKHDLLKLNLDLKFIYYSSMWIVDIAEPFTLVLKMVIIIMGVVKKIPANNWMNSCNSASVNLFSF